MSRCRLWCSLCAALAMPYSLTAQEPTAQAGAEQLFTQLDANHDGQISPDEVQTERRRLFDRLVRAADKDKNGSLSKEEFVRGMTGQGESSEAPGTGQAGRPRPDPGALFGRLDRDGDGKITLDELPPPLRARMGELIAEADKNGDKALSKEEFLSAGGQALRRLARRISEGEPGGSEGPGRRRGLLAVLDADRDGKLSAAEIDAAPAALKKLDKNQDGVVDQEELQAVLRGPLPPAGAPPQT